MFGGVIFNLSPFCIRIVAYSRRSMEIASTSSEVLTEPEDCGDGDSTIADTAASTVDWLLFAWR